MPVRFELSVGDFISAFEPVAKVIRALHPNYRQIKWIASLRCHDMTDMPQRVSDFWRTPEGSNGG